jgi:2-methylcitrate dehydratase PrpD
MPFDGRAVNPVGHAFSGAATIDAIDGHDGHQPSKGHAGVAILPSLLAELGQAPDCTMDELLADLIAGYEVTIRAALSLHATVPDYHSSGAWNALGCAAVAARLRGLTIEQTRHALGIAEYYGPRAQMMRCIEHPSMVKDSSSWGALTGISAADLAEDGFTGAPAITCEAPEVSELWGDLGTRWRILESNFKAYPVCRWAHPPIEAALALADAHEFSVSDIEEIIVTTFHEATKLSTRRPMDGDAAQYSLPLAVAICLIHGTIRPEHMLPQNYDRPDIWRLVDRVSFAESDQYNAGFPKERFANVTIKLANGTTHESETAVARGNFDVPLSDGEILEKLYYYAGNVLSQTAQDQISSILTDPSNAVSPAELVALLQPRPS